MSICLNCGSEVAHAEHCATCGAYTKVTATEQRGAVSDGFTPPATRLVRPKKGRVIAGVCAGLAGRFGMSVNLIRFLFVIPGVFWFIGPITYLVLSLKLKEWPPSVPEPVYQRLQDKSVQLEQRAQTTKNWGTILKLLGAFGVLCFIGGILFHTAEITIVGFFCLLATVPIYVVKAFSADRVRAVAKHEEKRLVLENHGERICSECNVILPAQTKVCPSCGSDKVFVRADAKVIPNTNPGDPFLEKLVRAELDAGRNAAAINVYIKHTGGTLGEALKYLQDLKSKPAATVT
ncbi:MAG: PspC domain-containing protein [Terriglobia bacterium]|nr:PspC domain-containing protein [Terriglobia bacterium]